MKTLIMKSALDVRPDLQKFLFRRGFLISRNSFDDIIEQFPFYGNWTSIQLGEYHFMAHKDTGFHYCVTDHATYFIMGHCYNPFTMEHEEVKQLVYIAEAYQHPEEFQRRIDELTGVFVLGWFDKEKISFLTDPSGIQSAFYGIIDNNFLITSHAQLIGDLYGLSKSQLVEELLAYKWYSRVKGGYLPADLSPFDPVKRVVPNILFTHAVPNQRGGDGRQQVSTHRFYPLRNLPICNTVLDYDRTICEASNILKLGAELVLKKWSNPALSLTGGIDSNTTFAAANGHYSDFATFTYLSEHKESIDVEAAEKIAAHFNVKHSTYHIPMDNAEIDDFDIKAAILAHNNGYVTPAKKVNDLRKRIYLAEHCPYDVEVKSWVSETIRAYWYKHFNRSNMPPLSPKLFRNLYKIFLGNRSLAHKIDLLFADYIERFEYHKIPAVYTPSDMFYSEVSMGSWGGVNISEMKYSFDITVLYNNRLFLDLLFRVPLEKRINDQHHLDMKKRLNRELYDLNIRVVNMEETRNRAFLLNLIFNLNTYLPF